ncbi:cytochrome P450 CYP72A219-like [Nicotiana tomentosiformis]|uniref:Cytochrome P450 CYP72A219-like n=1 Tax=Nicotiana tabacum TaxID=4097 RepID=A0A1S4D3D7_TOBAC|nr:PREDICTED: cytochrome P450 CYP72A219-like [Nicotiana tabacum]
MEIPYYSLKIAVSSLLVIFILRWAWKILNWVWFKPKELEKCLRQQGFKGNSYRFLFGDVNEMMKMGKEALSKPIDFSHDIWPRVMPFLHKTITTYGKNCLAWYGPRPAIVIVDPELIREVLTKIYDFQKPPGTPLTKLAANGLAGYEADKWTKHRRLINPAFHLDKLKHMLPAFQVTASEMLSKWEKVVSTEGTEIDVWPYLQTLTSDAISRTAFGSSYEEGRKIFELQKEQLELLLQIARSLYIPGWRFMPTKTNRRMKQIFNEVRVLILGIIKKRMSMIENGEAPDDLLGTLLASNLQEIQLHGNNKKFGMSIDEVIEECKLFYLAGQETTSALLVWTMILLCKYPIWQEQAREEVLQVFGSDELDYEKLNQLKVVTMILNEVMRLYPSGYFINRMVTKETKLGNLCLPAGVQLLLATILLHHDTEIWGDDAMEFNPERFSEGVAKATKGQLVFFPFSWGPRICIGQNFAMLEAKMATAMILKHYAFELSPSYAHAPHPLLLQPQYGAYLILHKL